MTPGVAGLAGTVTTSIVVVGAHHRDNDTGVCQRAHRVSRFDRETVTTVVSGCTAHRDHYTSALRGTPRVPCLTHAVTTSVIAVGADGWDGEALGGQLTVSESGLDGQAVPTEVPGDATRRDGHTSLSGVTKNLIG